MALQCETCEAVLDEHEIEICSNCRFEKQDENASDFDDLNDYAGLD